jgi:hypothetical protein
MRALHLALAVALSSADAVMKTIMDARRSYALRSPLLLILNLAANK